MKKINVYAKTAIVLTVLFWVPAVNIFTSILAIVFGFMALKDLKSNKNEIGRGIAVASIILGFSIMAFTFLGIIVSNFYPEILLG